MRTLTDHGLGKVLVYVGERLSYDDEKITCKYACELTEYNFAKLTSLIILNQGFKNRENENRMFQRATGAARYFQNSLNNKYNLTELDLENTAEPTVEITVSAGIVPKDVNKQAPNLNLPPINSPALPALNVNLPSPAPLNPSPVNVTISPVDLPAPIANPFTDYAFTTNQNVGYGVDRGGPIYGPVTDEWWLAGGRKLSMIYGGYKPDPATGQIIYTPEMGDNVRGSLGTPRHQSLVYANRKPAGFDLRDFTIYAAGDVGGAGRYYRQRKRISWRKSRLYFHRNMAGRKSKTK